MCRKSRWVARLLAAVVALTLMVGSAAAQDYGDAGSIYNRPDTLLPLPLNDRLPDGGLFTALSYAMYRTDNPIRSQNVANSGFISTNSLTGFNVGTYVGSATPRLDTDQVSGSQYTPGFKIDIGYRFQDATTLTLSWLHMFQTHKEAAATSAAPGFKVGNNFVDSFLTAPVFNFPPEYAGPNDLTDANGNPISLGAYGIWNAASVMTLDFRQRVENYDLTYRVPEYETESTRVSVQVGGRFFWIWERFLWYTNDLDTNNVGGGTFAAYYSNISSNRMYGPHAGVCWEQELGLGFALQLDLDAALLLDIVKERTSYTLGERDVGPEAKRSRTDYTFVPEASASLALMWYPYPGIQVRAGYNGMIFFNTISSKYPIDFNYGAVNPAYDRIFYRLFDGLDAGIAFIF